MVAIGAASLRTTGSGGTWRLAMRFDLGYPLPGGEMLPCIGVYAFVVRGGLVGKGYAVRVE